MKKRNLKKFIIISGVLLVVIVFLGVLFFRKSIIFNGGAVVTNEIDASLFNIYVSTDGKNYSLMSFDTWPKSSDNYVFNKAECYDADNEKIDSTLIEYDSQNEKIKIYTNSFVSCNVYFDYDDPCNDESITVTNLKLAYDRYCTLDNAIENDGLDDIEYLWDSTLTGDGYRYYSEITQTATTSKECNGYTCLSSKKYCKYTVTENGKVSVYTYAYDGDCDDVVCLDEGEGSCTLSVSVYDECTDKECNSFTDVTKYVSTGTDPNNYICFGTTSSSDCLSNTGTYLYRIIGIFADSSGSYHLKLIKATALSSTYQYSSSNVTSWSASNLYTYLNSTSTSSSYYLYNSSYISSSTWRNLIQKWNWKVLDSGYTTSSGTQYNGQTASAMYYSQNSTSSTVSNYVGLMYPADYLLSFGSAGLNYTAKANYSTLKYSWLFLGSAEYLMATDGKTTASKYYYPTISTTGTISSSTTATKKYAVRPVIYLNGGVTITSGTGSSTSPYMLSTTIS